MQTIEFLRAARWVITQFEEDTIEIILRGRLMEPDTRLRGGPFLSAAMNLAVSAERLAGNDDARAILEHFALSMLFERGFALHLANLIADTSIDHSTRADERPDRPFRGELAALVERVSSSWKVLERCLAPLEKLLVPRDVEAETDFDSVLTLEMRYDENLHPKASTVAEVLARTDVLYSVACRAAGTPEFPPLVVIYADSGSSVRFDFKGAGEPIKELKNFLVELWNRLRHRKADDYRTNADALLVGLKVVAGLAALEQNNVISPEDAARYKHDILESGVALFEAGAVPREIPRVEHVHNQRILAEVQRKLLPASPATDQSPAETTSKAAKRSKAAKKPRRSRRKGAG